MSTVSAIPGISGISAILPTLGSTRAPAASDIVDFVQQIQDEDIVASFAPTSSSADLFNSLYSGVYSSAGVLQSLPGALTDYWAQALQANPSLANIFAAEFFTQGVVGTLDVYA